MQLTVSNILEAKFMTTNLAIDDDLINESLTLGRFKTKEDRCYGVKRIHQSP
jgi:hypothetical protein